MAVAAVVVIWAVEAWAVVAVVSMVAVVASTQVEAGLEVGLEGARLRRRPPAMAGPGHRLLHLSVQEAALVLGRAMAVSPGPGTLTLAAARDLETPAQELPPVGTVSGIPSRRRRVGVSLQRDKPRALSPQTAAGT